MDFPAAGLRQTFQDQAHHLEAREAFHQAVRGGAFHQLTEAGTYQGAVREECLPEGQRRPRPE